MTFYPPTQLSTRVIVTQGLWMHSQSKAKTLTLTSRAFYSDVLGEYEKYITEYFGFDKVLPMNTGAEGVETAIKICRKWGYEKKGDVRKMKDRSWSLIKTSMAELRQSSLLAVILMPEKTLVPYTQGFIKVPYNDLDSIKDAFATHHNIVGVLVEPIQGEAGVVVPEEGFLSGIAELCKANNALFIADEIQTGIARTGSLLAVCGDCSCKGHCERQSTYVKPDMLILGKALSGGAYPVSAVLADNDIMEVITPGTHGSTYGGNPLASKVAIAALDVVKDEQLAQNARKLGELFRERMNQLIAKSDLVKLVRGKGLLNAIVINDTEDSSTAWDICVALKNNGLIAKPTHGNIIRFAPPLVMTEEQLHDCCDIIEKTILDFQHS